MECRALPEDLVRKLGYLTLGSRFKRLGERLQADVARLFSAQGEEVGTGLLPTLNALAVNGALTVGGLAETLGVAQPGITRNLAQLSALGLVKSAKPSGDRRQRTVSLTRKGAELSARTERNLWPAVERAVAEICEGLEGPLLRQLDAIEKALDEAPLDVRAAGQLKEKRHAPHS